MGKLLKFSLWGAATAILIGGIFFYSVGKVSDDCGSTRQDLTEITVAQTGDFLLYSGLYIAQQTCLFHNNGLSVRLVSAGGDEKSVAAVISGQAAFGVGDPTFAGIARQRGQDVRVVASVVNGVPFWGLTNDTDVVSRFRRDGLKGLTVATFPSPSTAYTLQKDMFVKQGLPVAIVEGAFGSLEGILEKGEADIALELEPNVSTLVENGAVVLYSMADMYGDFAITGVSVLGGYAEKNPSIVIAFCRSLQQAYDFARSNRAETELILKKKFPELSEAVIKESLSRMMNEDVLPLSVVIDEEAWRKAVALRVEVGDITDEARALEALDNSFATSATTTK